jgi:amidase
MQNIVGNPALSVPFGHLDSGLPFGFQVTAPHYYDDQLLAIADSWQSAFPWARSAPGYVALDTAFGL